MKKAEKVSKAADSSEQNLPGEALTSARPATSQSTPLAKSPASATSNPLLSPVLGADAAPGTSASFSSHLQAPPAKDTRLLSLERTQELLALHAMRLKESGGDTMRVVLEPGNGVHLSLELRQNSDGIEARASLHRGDFQFLRRHWPELQQRLERRGVHLTTLENSLPSSTSIHPSSNQARRGSSQEEPGSAFSEFAFAGSMTESPASRRARRKPGSIWESWG